MIALVIASLLTQYSTNNLGLESYQQAPINGSVAWRGRFATPGSYPSPVLVETGTSITFNRSSTKSCLTGPATMITAPVDALCVGPKGALLEFAAINAALRSQEAENAIWTKAGVTVVADQGVAPDGTTTMDRVTSAANSGQIYQLTTTASSATFTSSEWFATEAGSHPASVGVECGGGRTISTCTCTSSTGSCTAATSGSTDCIATDTIGTTPQWLTATGTCSGTNTGAYFEMSPGPWGQAGNNGASILAWGMQIEVGAYASSYKHTVGVAVAGSADIAQFANPIPNTGGWCVSITGTPESGRDWSIGTTVFGLADLNWVNGVNRAKLAYQNVIGSTLFLVTIDAAGAVLQRGYPPSYAPGSTHTLVFCDSAGGGLGLTSDGVSQTNNTASGTGTGIVLNTGNVMLGNTAQTNYFAGYIKDVVFCKSSMPGACR